MAQYIEFTTASRPSFREFSLRSPLHDGVIPGRLVDTPTVRIDGEPVTFVDENIPDILHKTLIQMRQGVRSSHDCRQFVALMNSMSLDELEQSSFVQPNLDLPIDPTDALNAKPVVIGKLVDTSPLYDVFWNRHMATPAHQPEQPSYLHKLGDGGPVCLSGLQAAIDMYDSKHAFLSAHYSQTQLTP